MTMTARTEIQAITARLRERSKPSREAYLGRVDAARVAEHDAVVEGLYGLPIALPDGVDHDRLVALMTRDKKAVNGLTFVLDGEAGVEVVAGVSVDAVRAALAAMP